jgi:hypothetical protein
MPWLSVASPRIAVSTDYLTEATYYLPSPTGGPHIYD